MWGMRGLRAIPRSRTKDDASSARRKTREENQVEISSLREVLTESTKERGTDRSHKRLL